MSSVKIKVKQPLRVLRELFSTEKTRTDMPKQQTSKMSMELQFLENHKKQYLVLSTVFASISFLPKSREALENMKDLVPVKILLGADIP